MTHTPLPAFSATAGPHSAKLALVGEAFGGNEAELGLPFCGEAGKELWLMLGQAFPDIEPQLHAQVVEQFHYGNGWAFIREPWLKAASIFMTNVLAFRPPNNKLIDMCISKTAAGGNDYQLPSIYQGKYLPPEYLPEIDRLFEELATVSPNLVVALGNVPSWALLKQTAIGSIRGATATGHIGASSIKVLPTYHPAAVLRNWAWRSIVVADLMKAAQEREFPQIRRLARTVLANPTIEEVVNWTAETLAKPPAYLSPDIETAFGQITCIGFARSVSESLVIPFVDKAKPGWNYWPTPNHELIAWNCVESLLTSPIIKVGQNFIYDLQYITRMGIAPKRCWEDTMLLHHSMLPEMPKNLGFLGSIYTNEASWKLMRRRKADSEKKDE